MNATNPGLIGLMVLAGGGCASSSYNSLPSERDVEDIQALMQTEFQPTTVRIPTRIDGEMPVHLAIHEAGNPNADRIVVLWHGCLSDSRAWRYVAPNLATDHLLLLIDLPGSGDSDRPHPRRLGPGGLAIDALTERSLQALSAYLEGKGDPDRPITFGGHSLGGTIALRTMANAELRARYDDVLDRVDRLVLVAPADVAIVNPPRALVEVVEASALDVFLGELTGILHDRVSQGTRDSLAEKASREEADRLYAMLKDPETLKTWQGILKQVIPMEDGKLDWSQVELVEQDFANVDVPCLMLWGARDEALPAAMGYKLATQVPTASLCVVPDTRHSVQLERPRICADVIRRFSETGNDDFLRDGPLVVARSLKVQPYRAASRHDVLLASSRESG